MKYNKLIFLFLFCPLFAWAQNPDSTDTDPSSYTDPVANTVPVFNLTNASVNSEIQNYLNSKLTSYSAYNFNYADLRTYLDSNMYALEFNIGSTFFSLQRRDIRSPIYLQTETLQSGETVTRYQQDLDGDSTYEVHFLKGFADRHKYEVVRFSIEENSLTGYIWNTETNHVLYYTSLQDFIKSNDGDFQTTENYLLIFDLDDLIADGNAICGALEATDEDSVAHKGYFEQCTPRFLEIAAEGDKKWCDAYGNNAAGKILETLFFVEGIYTHNFNLSFVVNNINLLPNNPNIYNTVNAYQRLYDFQNNWNVNHNNIQRDLTLLFSGIYSDTLGAAFTNTLCATSLAYGMVCKYQKITLTCAHEMGHIFGSSHDQNYGTSTCSGNDVPIMCAQAVANGPYYYFSLHTRNIILTSINNHAACLNGFANGSPVNTVHKTWSNYQNQRWIATWLLQNGDQKVVGDFDGENDDEEIFFAAPDKKWIGIMDFSCDQGTDWYHLWGNSGNGTFGTWYRNHGDKYMAGDFDGNGKADLFSVSGGASWSALQEYDPSSWSWIHKWGNAGTHWIAGWYINKNDTYTIGDFDGDGKDDLLCVNPNGWSQIIKFNWNTGGYYVPQTIWSNGGNGWVGGVQIGNTNKWLKGKFTVTNKDELLTISGTWVTTQRFDGSNWQWIWSQYGANNFASMYILPLGSDERVMTGNFDADSKDEFIDLNKTWAATADYNGSTYTQNWNNGGTHYLNDWNLNIDGEYLLVQAAETDKKQILGIRYEKRTSGWWLWQTNWWEPNLCGMYKGNVTFQNFRMAPEDNTVADNSSLKVYPNPTNDAVYVDFSKDVESAVVTVSDMTGKLVYKQTITQANNRISLKELPSGIYILNAVFSDHTSLTSKISVYGK